MDPCDHLELRPWRVCLCVCCSNYGYNVKLGSLPETFVKPIGRKYYSRIIRVQSIVRTIIIR